MQLTDIKGIGKKSKEALESKGIFSCSDLAQFVPSSYKEIKAPTSFQPNQKGTTLLAKLLEPPKTQFIKGGSITRAKAQDTLSGRIITLVWFNQRFASKAYKQNNTYAVFGNSRQNDFNVSMAKPQEKMSEMVGLYPAYKKTGINRKTLQNAIMECLNICPPQSIIPAQENQPNLAEAYKTLHNSTNKDQLNQALKRIQLEQAVQYLLAEGKYNYAAKKRRPGLNTTSLNQILSKIPFKLTNNQNEVLSDILSDFSQPVSSNRLIMGEVGSGKTILSHIAALLAVSNGYQVAIMCPTEILAKQHHDSFKKLFDQMATTAFLTSSNPNRAQIQQQLQNGQIQVVFGTHILSNSTYKNLGLVIIDEQQRFGVETRANLVQKSQTSDTISLSATPIPRSLLLATAGTLKVSKITQRPHKIQTKTHFVGQSKEEDLWNFVEKQPKTIVVCPKIDDEDDPFNQEPQQSSVESLTAQLKKRFGPQNVLRVDGSMQPQDQQNAVYKFKTGPAKILVATTVVEVGIDIPQSNTLIIRGADRFGLSTLHQLRGRIGRNGQESHCFIMLDKNPTEQSLNRLTYFKDHNNGFDIAEYDYQTRGAGDMFGTKQSGDSSIPFSAEVFDAAQQIVSKMQNVKQTNIANN